MTWLIKVTPWLLPSRLATLTPEPRSQPTFSVAPGDPTVGKSTSFTYSLRLAAESTPARRTEAALTEVRASPSTVAGPRTSATTPRRRSMNRWISVRSGPANPLCSVTSSVPHGRTSSPFATLTHFAGCDGAPSTSGSTLDASPSVRLSDDRSQRDLSSGSTRSAGSVPPGSSATIEGRSLSAAISGHEVIVRQPTRTNLRSMTNLQARGHTALANARRARLSRSGDLHRHCNGPRARESYFRRSEP